MIRNAANVLQKERFKIQNAANAVQIGHFSSDNAANTNTERKNK
jgi:hypothetical protein